MQHSVLWVVVADAGRARILQSPVWPSRAELTLVESHEHKLEPSHEIGSDRPGRSFDSGPAGQRHAMEPKVDFHSQQKGEFADAIALRLDHAFKGGRFAKLAVVAPPEMLGLLRQALPAGLRQAVIGEVAKDFTHVPQGELSGRIRSELA